MSHLNIYLSKERSKTLREALQDIARTQNRSLSYVVEEALVAFIGRAGKRISKERRIDHRRRN